MRKTTRSLVNPGQTVREGTVSVLDQFRTAEEQVAKRWRELRPLVAEYHELEQVAQRLGLSLSEDATVTGKPRPASPQSTRRRRRASTTKPRSTTKVPSATSSRQESDNGATAQPSAAAKKTPRVRSPRSSARKGRPGPARSSRREQDILRLVQQRPGVTVSEIAKQLEVDATGLYRPVHSSKRAARSASSAPRSSPPTARAFGQRPVWSAPWACWRFRRPLFVVLGRHRPRSV